MSATATLSGPSQGAQDRPMDLGYRYTFEPTEHEAAVACIEEHGFAIVKDLISESHCRELQESVKQAADPEGKLEAGKSFTHLRFVEVSPALVKLFDNPNWLGLQERIHGGRKDLTVHRSACILRNPGASGITWHTDYACESIPPTSPDYYLNRGETGTSLWFYLTGCYPNHGGLAIMPDSHREDWTPPAGFKFIRARKSFNRVEEDDTTAYHKNDVPGYLPIVASGRDGLLFHARTYHVAFTNHEPRQRLSCAMGTRPGQTSIHVPWPLTEEAKRLKREVREDLKPYFEHYSSVRRADEY
jgi:hypothetical protein